MAKFSYIITIHNKEKILRKTLEGVEACCSKDSVIYPVLDGCTDKSEEVVQDFIRKTEVKVIVTKTDDVHELKTINAGLRQIKDGYTIVLQDDVILQEPDLEKKVEELYKKIGPSLGNISFCRAANLRRTPFLKQLKQSGLKPLVEECDLVKEIHDPCSNAQEVEYEKFVYRMVAIKSPICIPESVLKKVGILDENLAPYGYDDHEYCLRILKAGFKNGLFPLRFLSKLGWGGTREDKIFQKERKLIHKRNRRYVYLKHKTFLRSFRIPKEYKSYQ